MSAPEPLPADLDAWLREGWAGPPATDLVSRYRACLALGSDAYAPEADRADTIAALLDAVPVDEPMERSVPRPRRVVPQAPTYNVWCDPSMGCHP